MCWRSFCATIDSPTPLQNGDCHMGAWVEGLEDTDHVPCNCLRDWRILKHSPSMCVCAPLQAPHHLDAPPGQLCGCAPDGWVPGPGPRRGLAGSSSLGNLLQSDHAPPAVLLPRPVCRHEEWQGKEKACGSAQGRVQGGVGCGGSRCSAKR